MNGTLYLYRLVNGQWHALGSELKISGPFEINGRSQEKPEIQWNITRPSQYQLIAPFGLHVDVLINEIKRGHMDCHGWAVNPSEFAWRWILQPHELSEIEEIRHGQLLYLTVQCTGLAIVENDVLTPIRGAGNLTIPLSEWEELLVRIHYEPAHYLTFPLESRHWPEWPRVVTELQGAIRALARGETHAALEGCLELLEKQQSEPYNVKSWKGRFDVDSQKDEGLAKLISGIGSYLNLVGHHRHRTERDSKGELEKSQVDQFEAEVLVAMTQLILAYMERLPTKTSAS